MKFFFFSSISFFLYHLQSKFIWVRTSKYRNPGSPQYSEILYHILFKGDYIALAQFYSKQYSKQVQLLLGSYSPSSWIRKKCIKSYWCFSCWFKRKHTFTTWPITTLVTCAFKKTSMHVNDDSQLKKKKRKKEEIRMTNWKQSDRTCCSSP